MISSELRQRDFDIWVVLTEDFVGAKDIELQLNTVLSDG
jgi:hypothetical protein